MKKYLLFLIIVFSALWVFSAHQTKAAPLTVHPSNPRYFTDDTGKPIYMTGSHTWFLIQKDPSMQQTDNSYQHMEDYLDWVQSFGHNYQRMWLNFHYAETTPHPWVRTGPGVASDGLPKFDMTKFDQAYFDLARQRILQATNRGMYISVLIFGSGVGMKDPATWATDVWNPNNNINPELAAAFSRTDSNTFYTSNTAAMNIQKLLVAKMIDTLNDQDNLIWEVINEGQLPEGEAWQNKMIDYIRTYESGKPKQHLVLMSGCGCNPGDVLFNSNADCISPDGVGSYSFSEGGDPSYTNKIVVADTDHVGGFSNPTEAETYRKWVWRAFTRGTNPIYMDSYDAYVVVDGSVWNNGTIMSIFNPVRAAMGHTLTFSNKMNLANMIPSSSSSNCSTTYCLRNAGNEYLIYQPISGSFTVNLLAGTYIYEWFNPSTGAISGTGSIIVAAGSRTFTPPFSGDAVLYLKISTAVPFCGDTICNGTETCSTCPSDCGVCPSTNPIAWWKFDETSGTTASDFSGNGNTGTLVNGPVWTTGKIGNALNFDGSDDVVKMGDVLDFTSASMSISAWIYPHTLGGSGYGRIVDKDDAGATGYQFLVDTNNTLSFSAVSGSSFVSSVASIITLNQWQHVAVTYDGSNARFYVNGAAKGAPVLTNVPVNTANPFAIGNRATALNRGFDGLIDDVRVYNRALTATEIQTLYNSTPSPVCGDFSCNGTETCSTCAADCGACPPPVLPGWTFCSNEGQQCNFSGTKEVQYGANSQYFTGIFTNGVLCANSIFGDPIVGVAKYCYYRSDITPPAAPTGVTVS